MPQIEVNGKRINLKPTASRFNNGYGRMMSTIYNSLDKIGISREYIDLPIPRNSLKQGEPALISWKVNGKDYFYQCSAQERFIDNLGCLTKVIEFESYAIRNGMKSFGQVMNQFRLEFQEGTVKTRTPREIMGIGEEIKDFEFITFKYKQKCKETHPDVGGNEEEFKQVQLAYDELKKELGK